MPGPTSASLPFGLRAALATTFVAAAVFVARPALAIVPSTETICDDCVDDDGDGDIDREDSDCPQPADGGTGGLLDPAAAKAAAKCQKAIQKAGAKFVSGKLKNLHKCALATFTCVQLKPEQTCFTKARGVCDKALGVIPQLEFKLENAVGKACGPDTDVSLSDLGNVAGLGYDAEVTACGGPFTSVQDIAGCIRMQHECKVERILATGVPRMAELLTQVGIVPDTVLPCLDELPAANGGGDGLAAEETAKAAVKCQKLFTKAGIKLVGATTKSVAKCVDGLFKCIQTKPGDNPCLQKAALKCRALDTKLRGVDGTITKLATKTTDACNKTGISSANFRSQQGLGFEAIAPRCSALSGFLSPNTVGGAVLCVGVQHLCDTVQVIEREVPRARSLADFAGIDLPG